MSLRRPVRSLRRLETTPAVPAGNGSPSADVDQRRGRAAIRLTTGLRGRHLLAIDLAGILIAAWIALALRFDQVTAPLAVPLFPTVVLLLLVVRTTCNLKAGLYSRRWRNASVPELERIAWAMWLGSLVSVAVFYGVAPAAGDAWADGFPRSFWPIELLLSAAILGGVRFGIRAISDLPPGSSGSASADPRATLLYGAGRTGALMARSARRHPGAGVRPVGFLDDDPELAGDVVAGIRVLGGLESMGRAVTDTGATSLLITMPGASGAAIRRVVEAATVLNLDVRTVPPMIDLLNGRIDAYHIRRIRVEDLLRRPMVTEHAEGVEQLIRNRTILITGGAGSIGSELARQVFALEPRRLVLVDQAESPLYMIQRELEARNRSGASDGEIRVCLADIADRTAMRRLMAEELPSLVFHAAAYKHVPMMEQQPSDAARVNIGGTIAVLDAAEASGVERFVFVSTDKAVRPSSVMGASKRIAEMLVTDMAHRTGRPYVCVRFGNVLGSAGSVVPILQSQLENGEPLTITHPDMTRFFMTIPEAAWLILDAAALGRDGDTFVLDMGEPIRVLQLATDVVRLAGRDPDSQPIVTIGLRPGEKLHEELFYEAEKVQPTSSAKVLRAIAPAPPLGVRETVEGVLALATGEREPELAAALLAYARATEPAPAPADLAPARREPIFIGGDLLADAAGGSVAAAL